MLPYAYSKEKAARIDILTARHPSVNTIKDEEMVELAEFFDVKYRSVTKEL